MSEDFRRERQFLEVMEIFPNYPEGTLMLSDQM